MSIGAKPWEGAGGAATVPDASETVKGKIRIATSAEATTGTDDLTAMTPLTVKERIDAAITGGIEYKGTFDASTGLPSLANAEKGDLYKISTAGTIYGRDWAVGDHLIINEDMGGTISNGLRSMTIFLPLVSRFCPARSVTPNCNAEMSSFASVDRRPWINHCIFLCMR